MTDLFDQDNEQLELWFRAFKLFNFMVADPMEIPFDLCMKNLISTCLDFDYAESLFERANYFLDLIFSQPTSAHY